MSLDIVFPSLRVWLSYNNVQPYATYEQKLFPRYNQQFFSPHLSEPQ